MHFDDLDCMMRQFETNHDVIVLPGIWMVARLDGKGFSNYTKLKGYKKPFDEEFSSVMRRVVFTLMKDSGVNFIYGYTQSDEISLLFEHKCDTFNRKTRKYNSTLAGLASAEASIAFGERVVFDCRISQLPTISNVADYFSWRQEDANRNALTGYAYWTLREYEHSARKATKLMNGMTKAGKNELLFNYGINYNEVELWHKRGIGFYKESYEKLGFDPIAGQYVPTTRTRIKEDTELPIGDDYRLMIYRLCSYGELDNSYE